MRKSELLERCNIDFLEDLAFRMGTLPRNHWNREKCRLASILSKKLDRAEADIVLKSYLLCLDAKEVADEIAPQQLTELVNTVKHFLNCDEYLPEVVVGRHRCDLIGFKGTDAIAIEIKSARDNVRKALDQVKYYQLWAKEVYLAYDHKHAKRVDRLPFLELGVGLLEILDSYVVKLQSKPIQHIPDPQTLLSLFTSKYLRQVARKHRIWTNGCKKELAEILSRKLDRKKINELLVSYLKSKT